MIIDPNLLSTTALNNLIDEFILREGTDYGHKELSLEAKRQHLLNAINKKNIQILYDPDTQTCNIVQLD